MGHEHTVKFENTQKAVTSGKLTKQNGTVVKAKVDLKMIQAATKKK